MPAIPLRKPGLVWFWCFNDACRKEDVTRQLRAFAEKGVSTLILHARPGLLVPYGGGEWFDLMRDVARQCVAVGIEPWLYDEDLCPSGNAGGWITAEHPELMCRAMERFEAPPTGGEGELFVFPTGTLLWVGLVPPTGSSEAPVELTERVGVIRRHWEVAPWDSRWYYAATPLYSHPRAISYYPEFALTRPRLPGAGWRLVAFVARPAGRDEIFGNLIDPLNPVATAKFLDRTHERYAKSLGPMLGKEVPAIFTDEPKYFGTTPWTPGLFESFQARHGYDLRPRLTHLFETTSHPQAMTTKLHFRQWCGQRFLDAWLKPVADWCHARGVALVGHISPEEDPVTQAMCVTNLVPTWEHFDLAGIDLIIPAVGDSRHPMLNVGAVSAVSAAQQMGKPGVLSETLGASGLEYDPRSAARVLAWQVVCGVSTIVIHGAFTSSLGLRRHEAPPDFGPDSPRFDGINDIDRGLRPFFEIIRESTQVAPVAMLWPIRSFLAEVTGWQFDDTGRRKGLNEVLLACLEAQVGVQILDEEMLSRAELRDGRLTIGKASYTTILLPPMLLIHERSLEVLKGARAAGLKVYAMGEAPTWVERGQAASALAPLADGPWEPVRVPDVRAWCAKNLARPVDVSGPHGAELRTSRWIKDGQEIDLVMNLGDEGQRVKVAGVDVDLKAGELAVLKTTGGRKTVAMRFDPQSVRPARPLIPQVDCGKWAVRFSDATQWQELDRPLAVYQIRPLFRSPEVMVAMGLTGVSAIGGKPVAEWMEYRAEIKPLPALAPGVGAAPAVLVVEPTGVRGRLTVSINSKTWDLTVTDMDNKAHEIDVTAALTAGGPTQIVFRVHNPMPYDGIKVPPTVYRGFGAVP